MLVNVTQNHIDLSNSGFYYDEDRANCCPVALALNEATGKEWAVTPNNCWRHYSTQVLPLPPEVISNIHQYDSFGAMEPFSFELEITQ